MKKLTGYIGAMIIVFALMGSILLGYALNINGSTVIINEYEDVTDVSGLYSYSDEKSYIGYNPASNYISYKTGIDATYNNPVGGNIYKKIVDGDTITVNYGNKHVSINGIDGGTATGTNNLFAVFCNQFYIYFENGITLYDYWNTIVINNNFTVTLNGTTATITITGGSTYNYTNVNFMVAYSSVNPDYYIGSANTINDYYVHNSSELLFLVASPNFRIFYENNWIGVSGQTGTSGTFDLYTNGEQINDDVIKYSLGGAVSGLGTLWNVAYPIETTINSEPGIIYTESNRVNNYPTSQYSETRTTTTNQFDLSNMTGILTNYAPTDEQVTGRNLIIGSTPDFAPEGNSLMTNIKWSWPNTYRTYNFLLADIINSQAIPATTYQIKITFDSSSYSTFDGYLATAHLYKNFDINTACLNYNDWFVDTVANYNTTNNKILEVNDVFGEKDYVIYDPSTGTIDIYNYLDVKIATRSAYNTYVTCAIYDNSIMTGTWDGLFWYSTFSNSYSKNRYIQTNPMISSGGNTNLVTATYYQMSSTPATYMDVTKGVKIDPSNVSDTTWNNEYENGDVQIVFRSESIGNNYTNQIQTMAGDIITVDYTDSKYYVAINSEEAVEIGNWRNIVLDLNFNHDTVTVYPVKTFNSFIDVIVYDTPITIGKITHTDNTQLKWLPTTNSLMFSVYKTSVFMNTYGVVMVDPSLDITNYFTDLNQFYRLKIYNFSIYGDGMTINGVSGTVTGNKITFNDETVTLNEMYVTYSDGHVYVQDSNASIDLGETTSTNISMVGAWYFNSFLERGYTTQKTIYEWDWSSFVVDNTEFCIFYIGLALAGLIIARKFCSLSIIDYVIFITSIVLALSIQVIA